MIVCKFGGSSLADGKQFAKVKAIVQKENRHVVVASAAGKRFKEDNKLTDLLYLVHAHLQYGVSYDELFSAIVERLCQIRDELDLKTDIETLLDGLKQELCKGISKDYLVSRGEYFTSLLLAEYLGYYFLDAKEAIVFNYNGTIDFKRSDELIKEAYAAHGSLVIPGFYGGIADGSIRLMKRGGSDITGSIVARALKAEVYENWTDVSGIMMVDPRICPNPKHIARITYAELRELSYMGATVLHEDAVYPVKDAGIPILIRNTNDPSFPGTLISSFFTEQKSSLITGIAGKQNFTIITVYRHNASNEVGILKKALATFERFNISVEHVPTGIDNFSFVVSGKEVENCLYELAAELKAVCNADSMKIVDGISLIAIVGRNMANQPGVSGALFKTLGANDINIRMINQGSDEISIIVGIKDEDFEKTIKVLYETFKE